MLYLLKTIPLKKTDTSSPGSYQFLIASQLGLRLHANFPSPCWNMVWLELALWLHMCSGPAVSRGHCFLIVIYCFCLLQYFHPSLLKWSLSLGRRKFSKYVQFRGEHSAVSYSLYLEQLWVSILIYLIYFLQKEASLMKFERTNLSAAQRNPVSNSQEKFLIDVFHLGSVQRNDQHKFSSLWVPCFVL